MPRGRRPLPDEIKALRGNPGKRKLAQDQDASGKKPPPKKPILIEPPAFLTDEREKQIFLRVVKDFMPRNVAHSSDLTAYGRWAAYVHRWIHCKEQLDGKETYYISESKWGVLRRRHPFFKDMLDLERVLQTLEDRLGLNPIARQNLIRGLAALPAPLGGLFDDPPPEDAGEQDGTAPEPLPAPEESPLGYLHDASRLN